MLAAEIADKIPGIGDQAENRSVVFLQASSRSSPVEAVLPAIPQLARVLYIWSSSQGEGVSREGEISGTNKTGQLDLRQATKGRATAAGISDARGDKAHEGGRAGSRRPP